MCVGDCPFTEPMRAVVNATREALVNAAKHAGTGKVDVYVEVSPSAVEVFVRDRGVGFDPADVPEDRMGVRGSIVDRMDRHGGSSEIRSTPGEGTEVRLRLPRKDSDKAGDEDETMSLTGERWLRLRQGPRRHRRRPRDVPGRREGRARRRRRRGRRGRPTSTAPSPTIEARQPAVVLLDVHLPGGGGVEVIRRAQAPDTRYLALSVSDAAEDVIGTIRGGARGYVTKTITGPELVDAIKRVDSGDAVFSPRLAGFVLDAFAGSIEVASVDEDLDRLSEREREVMRLIARGYAYKEVAKELFISIKTVETHMSSRAAQAAAFLAPRADQVGLRPAAALSSNGSSVDRSGRRLHVVLLVIHIAGIVALLAGILVQVRRPEKRVNGLMRDGVGTAFLAGLFLVGVLEAGDDPVDHTKIAVKFAIGLVLLVLVMANLRKEWIPHGLYWALPCSPSPTSASRWSG